MYKAFTLADPTDPKSEMTEIASGEDLATVVSDGKKNYDSHAVGQTLAGIPNMMKFFVVAHEHPTDIGDDGRPLYAAVSEHANVMNAGWKDHIITTDDFQEIT